MTISHRIRTGTHDASDMTDTYAVKNFTVQSDQKHKWVDPVSPSGRVSEYDALTDGGLTGNRKAIGKINFSDIFGYVTPLQTQYIRAQLFPTDGLNEALTVVTWDDNEGWICVNCTAHWNDPARTADALPGIPGQRNLRIDFTDGTIADSGGAFSSAFSTAFHVGGIPS